MYIEYCMMLLVFLFLTIISYLMYKEKIPRNIIGGYRTTRAMKNDRNWYYANKIYGKFTLIISIIIIIFYSVLLILKYLNCLNINSLSDDQSFIIFFTPLIIYLIYVIFLSIFYIEKKLKKFEKSNNYIEEKLKEPDNNDKYYK